MVKRVEFKGRAARPAPACVAAEITIDSDQPWLWVEVVNGHCFVWSAEACDRCELVDQDLRRCKLHERALFVAKQLRII